MLRWFTRQKDPQNGWYSGRSFDTHEIAHKFYAAYETDCKYDGSHTHAS